MTIRLSAHIETWPARIPFRIAGREVDRFDLVVVELRDGDHLGRGEGVPIHYLGESAASVHDQIMALEEQICAGLDRETLQALLPPGAARNALDCAFWDLAAKASGHSIWTSLGLQPRALETTVTIGIEATPDEMAERAVAASAFRRLKIKVGHDRPVERVAAIRSARPDAILFVDANQGWTLDQLVSIAPQLADLGVQLVEQPLPRHADDALCDYQGPVLLSADESCQHLGELARAAALYQVINLKLDKVGGLTAGLVLADAVKRAGRSLLVSNMGGTSLSMAPAFVLAQHADFVELDGQFALRSDRPWGIEYSNFELSVPSAKVWG